MTNLIFNDIIDSSNERKEVLKMVVTVIVKKDIDVDTFASMVYDYMDDLIAEKLDAPYEDIDQATIKEFYHAVGEKLCQYGEH